MANVTPNLIKIGQSNIKNPKKIVDTHDTNMEKMKVYLTKLSTYITDSVYLEFGSAAWSDAGVEITLINGYTVKPEVTYGMKEISLGTRNFYWKLVLFRKL